MPRRVVALLAPLAVLALVAVVVAGVLAWRSLQRTDLERATAWLPGSTLRATWTDWEQVRSLADGTSLDAASTTRQVDQFLSRAYDQDLLSTSAVSDSTYAMAERYGFSPLDASWEMYAQSREGQVVVLRLPEEADLDGVERNLRGLGYDAPPDGAGAGHVWRGSPDLVAGIDESLTPVLQNVVVLQDERLVLLSDDASYASSAADVVRGDADGLTESTDGVGDLADLAGEPASAVLFASDFACEALGMAAADAEDQARADELAQQAGGVHPLAGLVLASDADHRLTVGMHFESSDQARADLQPRVDLASGEAPGQGGTFPDRFRIEAAEQQGSQVVLELVPTDGSSLVSDLAQGPLLFATC